MTKEFKIEQELISNLVNLKYSHRENIRDRSGLESNFREKFEYLNQVKLTDDEFERLFAEIVTADVFMNAARLRSKNTFERADGTPLHYQLVNLSDWCKNSFEVVSQLRINTRSSHHR
jgi:type I restriction enzyme, R subunit